MADASRKPYKSPAGTYECILKSALEDISLSDYARSVLFFAVTKPEHNNAGERWVLSETALVRDMRRPPERIRLALRELRRAGYASVVTERDEQGRVRRMTTVLNHEKVHAGAGFDRKVNATYQQVSDRKVNHHPVVSYPPSDYGTNSDYGSVLSNERTKENGRTAYADAPADRPGVSLEEHEEDLSKTHGSSSAQRESQNPAAIRARRPVCGCCGERRASGWFELRGPASTMTEALCDDCTGAYPSTVTVTALPDTDFGELIDEAAAGYQEGDGDESPRAGRG